MFGEDLTIGEGDETLTSCGQCVDLNFLFAHVDIATTAAPNNQIGASVEHVVEAFLFVYHLVSRSPWSIAG